MLRLFLHVVRLLIYGAIGALLTLVAVLVVTARSGPQLEPWHRAELDEEFTGARADEVTTFAQWLELEARLFDELDAEVYAVTERGAAYAVARYSAGSEADPRGRERNWNRSFELPLDDPTGGVLLLHGMSDSPYSLRAIGQALHVAGNWVVGLRLPGHGTVPAALTSTRWQDMAGAVGLAMSHLAAQVGPEPVHVVGYSTGAPLAIDHVLNAREAGSTLPRSLVLISPAVGITPVAALARWRQELSFLPGLERLAWTSILPEYDPYKYNSFATNAADQVYRLTRSVAARIEERARLDGLRDFPPTLVLLSTVDATVSAPAVIDVLLEHLPSSRHELVLFDTNRLEAASTVLVADPGPLTRRLMDDPALPFALTLLTNQDATTSRAVARRKRARSTAVSTRLLAYDWPPNVVSLSHVALPFSPDDPLYGRRRPGADDLQLGEIRVRGELGVLRLPSDALLRLRHNPFYDYLEARALDWMDAARPEGEGP